MNPYAKFLGDLEALAVIGVTPERLRRLVTGLGPARVNQRPAEGKWSAREILCHLADCELVFCFRLRQTLAEEDHVIQPFDQDAWAGTYGAYDADAALEMFRVSREWNLRLLASLPKAEYGRRVTHPERGTMTFRTIVETMAGHDLNHLGQIEAILYHAAVRAASQ